MYTKHPQSACVSNDIVGILYPFLLMISESFVEEPNAKVMPGVFFLFPCSFYLVLFTLVICGPEITSGGKNRVTRCHLQLYRLWDSYDFISFFMDHLSLYFLPMIFILLKILQTSCIFKQKELQPTVDLINKPIRFLNYPI